MADDSEQLEPGRAAFNRGEYFLAHELWEEVWRKVGDAERRLSVQGLIQIAAGLHHLQQHRAAPASGLLRNGLEKLSKRRGGSSGDLPVELLVGQVERLLVELDAPRTKASEVTVLAALGQIKL
jgi:predicted metal-dependent hydrolase